MRGDLRGTPDRNVHVWLARELTSAMSAPTPRADGTSTVANTARQAQVAQPRVPRREVEHELVRVADGHERHRAVRELLELLRRHVGLVDNGTAELVRGQGAGMSEAY